MKHANYFIIPAVASACLLIIPAALIAVLGLKSDIAQVEVGVVLGNTVLPSGIPSQRLMGRLDKCIELYNKGLLDKIIVSGGLGKEGHVEAVVMREYLISKGIDETVIIEDGKALNTFYTAQFVTEYCRKNHLSSVMVITQFYHIPRSQYALKRFGWKKVYKARADYFEPQDIPSLYREVIAFSKYMVRKYPRE